MIKLKRYENNPIISPVKTRAWEAKATFNPGVLKINNKVYILYRAMSNDNTSCLGLAVSGNGFDIDEREESPFYFPRERFETKMKGNKNTGCEDPRLTLINDRIYMCYTAVGEADIAIRVALTSISKTDFVKKRCGWEKPRLISPAGTWDKNACLLERKVKNKYVFFHRIFPDIWIDFKDSLDNIGWVLGHRYINAGKNSWDDDRIGIACPPIYTKEGWILIYHGRSSRDNSYRLGAMLLDRENPCNVISRLDYPILEPEEWYERRGLTDAVVFSCGCAVLNNEVFVYYGAADTYVCVATVELDELLSELTSKRFYID